MAIVIERTITVKNNIATLDNPLYLYTGDGDITCLFTIKEIKKSAKFGKINEFTNLITEGVGYGEVRIYKPDDQLVSTSRAEIIDDKLQALFSFTNIDQLTEAGIHQLQIHLYDAEVGERNRFTIPPVELNVLFPVGTTTSLVGQATVDYAMAKEGEEPLNTFNTDGSYNRTEWNSGDKITANKLNKIEDALYEINAADADFVTTMDLNNALVYKANANHSHSEYVEKNNLPSIPTKVSQLTNDAGYITEIPAEYITETELLAKNYANKDYVTSRINEAQLGGGGDNPSIDLSAYALKDDLADYVTNVELDEKDYANKAYVNNAIKNAQFDSDDIDLSDYALKSDIPTIPTSISAFTNDAGYVTEAMVDTKIDNAQIDIDLSNYALKSEIPTVPINVSAFNNDVGYLTQHQSLDGYATQYDVSKSISDLMGNSIYPYYALKSDLPTKVSEFTNDAGYITESVVNDKIDALPEYALKTDIPTVPTNVSAFTNDKGYVVSDSIVRIKIVTSYPETQEKGVLYIKVSE
jgi:hypothetical protein